MRTISIGRSFELFLDTLSQCGKDILKMSDEMIAYYILEEFITGVSSFLNNFTLDRLENKGIIDPEISEKSKILQKKAMGIDNTERRSAKSIKNSTEWEEIINLSDEIKALVHEKWKNKEIEYLIHL